MRKIATPHLFGQSSTMNRVVLIVNLSRRWKLMFLSREKMGKWDTYFSSQLFVFFPWNGRQFDLANREAMDESAEWRRRYDDEVEKARSCSKKLNEEKIHRFTSDDIVDQSRPSEGCSKLSGLAEDGTSTSAIGISMMPDFSLLKGEIHRDNLTMKELQETFKATFGRETSVKDKRWLKRRIIMGLTNSCDFSATTLVIADNWVVKKGKGVDCVVQSSRENTENSTCFADQKGMHSNDNRTKYVVGKENESVVEMLDLI